MFPAALCAFAVSALAQDGLPPQVAEALRAAKVPLAAIAISVQEAGAPRPALSLNDAVPMSPASVMKLVTTYAALDRLGPAYRWKTEAFLDGDLRDGVLSGDLMLQGGGDPKLNLESFWVMLRALRAKGLREVRGNLVLDRNRFARAGGDPARFDGDPFRPYNVLPDALLVNYRSMRFTFHPEPGTGTARISVEPRPPALEVVNVLKLSTGPCPEGRAFRDLLAPTFEPAKQRAIFAGRFPASCGEKDLNVALLEPNDHVGGIVRQLWAELGGAWTGVVRDGAVPAGAAPFHAHDSPALAELVRDVNKLSNNVMARHLFLTLGLDAAGAPASPEKSVAAVRDWLRQKGLAAPELVMENGSGLSRAERISAASMTALLQSAWRSSVMPEFASSLPVAATDGTMRRRLKSEGVAGQAHIKTGLLSDARSMAGYVLDRRGRRMVVVMIVNHANAPQSQEALDALLRWVYERG
ncbi:MAG: D-alanyl-D-alanine carboxypeptidase/D-alanyl-D-alanine-endopeptidase [Betaproteobacteria bacterium]|nr:D-alanyl-D-alanine carboxypeptidase/D-alanyl-D-alanine-endopeptidase [Betaproteobacteria bacterium]